MLICRSCKQAFRHAGFSWISPARPRRSASTRAAAKELLQTTTPVAKRLKETSLWNKPASRNRKASAKTTVAGDKTRVNVVSEQLCDDIVKYIGPTLERHRGCDLIDINPGTGTWSQKLHDAVQPRSHILMEPDEVLYKPFLEPLLVRPGTRLIPKSGILWRELTEVLQSLPRQKEMDPKDTPTRNDSLLVTMNLSSYPIRRYRGFRSVALMIMWQLLASIRSGTFVQKYGLVRMLLWVNNDAKGGFLPRSVQRRRNSAVTTELACEWLDEIAGLDAATESVAPSSKASNSGSVRDRRIDLESVYATLQRMKDASITMPTGRETVLLQDFLRDSDVTGNMESHIQVLDRPFMHELQALEEAHAKLEFEKGTRELVRLKDLRYLLKKAQARNEKISELLSELDHLAALRSKGIASEEELAALDQAWNDKVSQNIDNFRVDLVGARDNRHAFRQDPPVLLWDRRRVEPLAVQATEFFPNVECCLLDLQPKAMHPLLRAMGPGTSRSGDMSDLMLRAVMRHYLQPMSKALEALWPGAADGVLPHCPSLRDAARGGLPGTGLAELTPRIMGEAQWVEVMRAWMAWPFRPSYEQMIARLTDDDDLGDAGYDPAGNRMAKGLTN